VDSVVGLQTDQTVPPVYSMRDFLDEGLEQRLKVVMGGVGVLRR
jgi:hypothetical protein